MWVILVQIHQCLAFHPLLSSAKYLQNWIKLHTLPALRMSYKKTLSTKQYSSSFTKSFLFFQVGKAMQRIHERKNVGKIILSPMKEPEPEPVAAPPPAEPTVTKVYFI